MNTSMCVQWDPRNRMLPNTSAPMHEPTANMASCTPTMLARPRALVRLVMDTSNIEKHMLNTTHVTMSMSMPGNCSAVCFDGSATARIRDVAPSATDPSAAAACAVSDIASFPALIFTGVRIATGGSVRFCRKYVAPPMPTAAAATKNGTTG